MASRPNVFSQAVDSHQFHEMVGVVRTAGEAAVRSAPEFVSKHLDAKRAVTRELLRARRSLAQRNAMHRAEYGTDLSELELEELALIALEKVVFEPRFRLDEMGFFAISGIPPQGGA